MKNFQIIKTTCKKRPKQEHNLITEKQNFTLNYGRAVNIGYRSVELRQNNVNRETYILFSKNEAPKHLLTKSVVMMLK